MGKFMSGIITGGIATAAGAYYLSKNKDKGRHMVQEGKDVLNKAEDCLDRAEKML